MDSLPRGGGFKTIYMRKGAIGKKQREVNKISSASITIRFLKFDIQIYVTYLHLQFWAYQFTKDINRLPTESRRL